MLLAPIYLPGELSALWAAQAQREAFRRHVDNLLDRRRDAEARMRAIMDGVIWRAANPVLSRGWDDWSLLVRDEGWR